jgi:hypothetical protein
MLVTTSVYLVAYYARDVFSIFALGAAITLFVMGFFRASRGLALRNAITETGLMALVAGTVLSTVPIDSAFLLSRVAAVEILVAAVIVWLFSIVIQAYYGA